MQTLKRHDAKYPNSSQHPPDLSITTDDQVHLHTAGYNESPERGLVHSMARFRSAPLDFIREVSLYVSGSTWRAYDDIIGQPIFYPGFSENMKSMVLSNSMLVGKVRELAEASLPCPKWALLQSVQDVFYTAKSIPYTLSFL